jgi:hypothetical protein
MSQTRRSLSTRADGSCPTGYHHRKAYTIRRTGTRVGAACVRSTTPFGPRSEFLRQTRVRMSRRLRGIRKTLRGPRRCPPGMIRRAPYVRIRRDTRTFVPASCIPDVGAPGKGLASGASGIGPLRTGDLSRFGYDNVVTLTQGIRHLALAKAIREYGSLTVWRKLNAVYIYTRRSSPSSSRVFKADRDWIKEHYGIKAF